MRHPVIQPLAERSMSPENSAAPGSPEISHTNNEIRHTWTETLEDNAPGLEMRKPPAYAMPATQGATITAFRTRALLPWVSKVVPRPQNVYGNTEFLGAPPDLRIFSGAASVDATAAVSRMVASTGAASRKRTELRSGAHSEDSSVYSPSSEDCSDDDFHAACAKPQGEAKKHWALSIFGQFVPKIQSQVHCQYNYFCTRTRYEQPEARLNRQSVSLLLEAVAPNEVTDVRLNTRKKCLGY
ncbi:hypothetical protein HPB50_010128 [Hyalomma asiaticum]|uniref:Uncharacterized protein n=1 Tax=Hyalomma asiaticum TaxID=266040 RepID=A0ACB7TFN0_HYAAI|nr:hypothetical protein HPB50_010128 [Hyalomma asiaticum]